MEQPQKPHISSRDEEERRIFEYQEKQRELRRQKQATEDKLRQ